MLKWIRESKLPTWMIAGAITGGLIAFDLRYALASFFLVGLSLSYTYGYSKGAEEMHDRIFTMIDERILTPLRGMRGPLNDMKTSLKNVKDVLATDREIKETSI